MNTPHLGSCLCERVSYQFEGEFDAFFLCHCKYCQKDTGSAHAANLFSSRGTLKWLTGKDHVKTYNVPSTRHSKSFCKECSSALPDVQMDGKLIVIPAGSLTTAVTMKPMGHLFCASRASWDVELENVPKFEHLPT